MFKIDEELTIHITRGDVASFEFSAVAEGGNNDSGDDDITTEDGEFGDWVPGGDIEVPDVPDPDVPGVEPSVPDVPMSGGGTTEEEGSADSVTLHQFQTGDVIRFTVMEKKGCDNVVMSKDFIVESPTYNVNISLKREDTRIGEVISKPKDYWYEIELNPETVPQTIIGYDEQGPKVFRLYPEGGVAE
jgi:hypothetical protein